MKCPYFDDVTNTGTCCGKIYDPAYCEGETKMCSPMMIRTALTKLCKKFGRESKDDRHTDVGNHDIAGRDSVR